jgi:hypothetical protein
LVLAALTFFKLAESRPYPAAPGYIQPVHFLFNIIPGVKEHLKSPKVARHVLSPDPVIARTRTDPIQRGGVVVDMETKAVERSLELRRPEVLVGCHRAPGRRQFDLGIGDEHAVVQAPDRNLVATANGTSAYVKPVLYDFEPSH